MTSGLLLAMTLPGLVLLLLALAVLEQVTSRLRWRSLLSRKHRPSLSATGIDVLAVLVTPEKEHELEARGQEKVRRLNQHDSPPSKNSVDLSSGVAHLRRPRHSQLTHAGVPDRSALRDPHLEGHQLRNPSPRGDLKCSRSSRPGQRSSGTR